MTADPKRVEALFAAALEKPPAEQGAYLGQVCGDDADLRDRVERLLRAHTQAGMFLEAPAGALGDSAVLDTPTEAFDSTNAPGRQPESSPPTQAETHKAPEEVDLSFLSPSSKPGSLGRLAHYEVQEVLGRGGFGTVFKAFDELLHRVVAIKVMAPQMAANAAARHRFLREARAGAAVRHQHLIDIHAVAREDEPMPYLVMEYVSGQTLQEKLDRVGPLEVKEILRIGMQIARGLAAAHKQGLIHRDIKPGNILLENGIEHVKITDFGLARTMDDASVTQSGVVAGTPMYMSPEQAEGLTLDHRSDLFSLGTVLYVMCTGRPPFRASGTIAVLKRVVEEKPRPIRDINSEIPQWLCDVVEKLHAKKPEERFQAAAEVADVLAKYLADIQLHGSVLASPIASAPGDGARRGSPDPAEDVDRRSPESLDEREDLRSGVSAGSGDPRRAREPRPPARARRRRYPIVLGIALLLALGLSWVSLDFGPGWFLSLSNQGILEFELVGGVHGGHLFLKRDGQPAMKLDLSSGHRLEAGEYQVKEVGTHGDAPAPDYDVLYPQTVNVARGQRQTIRIEWKAAHFRKVEIKEQPPLAVAPFDEKQAKAHQAAWAKHLGVEPEVTNSLGMKLRLIPPGEFTMGATEAEIKELEPYFAAPAVKYLRSAGPAHKVRITRPTALGADEVTVGQFAAFVQETGHVTLAEKQGGAAAPNELGIGTYQKGRSWKAPGWPQTDDFPVVAVSWHDAVGFCEWLSKKEGRQYRLPTEAEWEYACRAGTTTPSGFGPVVNEKQAVFGRGSKGSPEPVGKRAGNAFGIRDMHGNVHEWCLDSYHEKYYNVSPIADPPGPQPCPERVLRGQAFDSPAQRCTSFYRFGRPPEYRAVTMGFRVALVGDLKAANPPVSKGN